MLGIGQYWKRWMFRDTALTQAIRRVNDEIKSAVADPLNNSLFRVVLLCLDGKSCVQAAEDALAPERLRRAYTRDDLLRKCTGSSCLV